MILNEVVAPHKDLGVICIFSKDKQIYLHIVERI